MTTYTPGLKVVSQVRHRVRRVLPIAGDVLVRKGDRVGAEQIVAQTFMPGDVTPLNLAQILSISAAEVKETLLKREGDSVQAGDLLARTKGIFGLFKNEYRAKGSGTIESVSSVTGQVILRGAPLPVQVRAYLAGTVVEVLPQEGVVIEGNASLIQGIFGVGGEAYGPLRMACAVPSEDLTPSRITPQMKGAVLVGGARATGEAVREAIKVGVSAIVCGGIDDKDLRDVLGYDLGVAVTGSETIGLTLIITEGFGDIAMADRTFSLLNSRAGASAAVSGATQIRAGVLRPEIIIPGGGALDVPADDEIEEQLRVGASVRMIRDPYFGRIGRVAGLPPDLHVLASESKARVLEVEFAAGERAVVPRANVELIESEATR